jgi:23S rRNA pseudouridine1911/1915/1917 synthase
MLQTLHFEVESEANRKRLDEYLFDKIHSLSRMYLRELVRTNRVQVNGEFENIGHRLRPNDFVEVEADLSRGTAMRPENMPLNIVFEDDHLIIVNKPSGMLVHPTHREKNGTLLNGLAFYLNQRAVDIEVPETDVNNNGTARANTVIRPGLVHRLDKETSGILVVAKTAKAHRRLASEFLKKQVEKRYLALVDGIVADREGIVSSPIGRYADLKFWDVKPDGKPSETKFRVLKFIHNKTLLELEPVTGRTNQLRIHCAAIGHPITGDTERGGSEHQRLCLHAWRLAFQHPETRELLRFEAQLSDEFNA